MLTSIININERRDVEFMKQEEDVIKDILFRKQKRKCETFFKSTGGIKIEKSIQIMENKERHGSSERKN